MIGRPRRATLFPYTPLFRSDTLYRVLIAWPIQGSLWASERNGDPGSAPAPGNATDFARSISQTSSACRRSAPSRAGRSEEHTSELQSRLHLVCRLLLEKKQTLRLVGLQLKHHVARFAGFMSPALLLALENAGDGPAPAILHPARDAARPSVRLPGHASC